MINGYILQSENPVLSEVVLPLNSLKLFCFFNIDFECIKKFLRIAKRFNFRTKGVFCGDVRYFLYQFLVLEI